MKLIFTLVLVCVFSLASAEGPATRPYTDPSQLDVPWPKHSYLKEPWRGFLETRSADAFVHGIGINFNVQGNQDLAMRLLAESGFTHCRIEFGWGSINWDETAINDEARAIRKLELCKKYHIRPILLLNAHHGVPCPVKFFDKPLKADTAKGARSVVLTDMKDIVPGHTGINNTPEYIAADVIITAVNAATGECTLSKPLPMDLKAGPIHLATLKHLPFFPVGTKEFDDTSEGWTKYTMIVAKLAADAGLQDFDLEFWNELSFGSQFVDANHYFDRESAPADLPEKVANFLHPGGSAWEITHRAIDAVKTKYPKVRCIWGWSNTTFYHTPIDKLPPGTDGQSYHPYGTGVRHLPKEEDYKDRPEFNVDGFTPEINVRMPEGWAHTFMKTECIMRLLNPKARETHPPGVEHFYHYMTEHGVAPPECGVTDETGSFELKSKVALRSFCLWLNKGVDVMDYYCAWERDTKGFGLLPGNLPTLPADSKFDAVATPPMRAMRNLTKAFAGGVALKSTTPLTVEVAPLGPPVKVFEGSGTHPALLQQDVFAFLPFQSTQDKFIIPVYIMSYDITKPFPDQRYQVTIKGLPDTSRNITLYDPILDKTIPLEVNWNDGGQIKLLVTDYPRLLVITK